MNSILSKILVLALGVNLGTMTIEATAPRVAIAQQLCQSYKVTRGAGLYVYDGRRIITTLPYGQIVSVTGLSSDGEWASIEYLRVDGQIGEGWVGADHLACYQE